ncbi:MAG: type II secretion system F family protein [Candidatus Bathyarchaeia archaeon]|jgi:flagellar protein FlaJ
MGVSGGFIGKIFGSISKASSEEKEKTERELPFAVMIFTLMAASGISPYDSWKRMRKLDFLPAFKKEADEVVRQVEVLGKDPLTVLQMRAEATGSKLYRNFLGGFVSSIRSGGKMVDYMKSQLKAIFELRFINLNRSIEKIATLVEAYSVMLIVVLCSYILFVVLSSTNVMSLVVGSSLSASPLLSYVIAFVIMPVGSCIFILMAHNLQQSAFPDLKDLYKRALFFIPPVFVVIALFALIPQLSQAISQIGLPAIATICLVAASLPIALQYRKISKINYNAEESLPNFIRDITESQKTGLSPEKSIIQATKRKDYGPFSKFLELMRSQIEWGIPLRKTFENIRKEIRSWFVTVNFAMMVETIEVGGNQTQSLEILSEYSEKEHELQINRRELLKPYILLAFMWSGLIAVTTTIVALTTNLTTSMMTTVNKSSLASVASTPVSGQLNMFSVGIIIQCWISGFFIGKISEGNLGAGFKHAALLATTAYVSLVVSQIVLSRLFGGLIGT